MGLLDVARSLENLLVDAVEAIVFDLSLTVVLLEGG